MTVDNYEIALDLIRQELRLPEGCPPALVVRTVREQSEAYRTLAKAMAKALEENVTLKNAAERTHA